MRILDLHAPSRRFLRSTQLERDFADPQSLEGYILTSDIETGVGRLMRGLSPNSGHRAWRITGDYGSGKSSFALLLATLVWRESTALPKHLRHLRRDNSLQGSRQKLLPILVTGSLEPLSLALLKAVSKAFSEQIDGRLALRSRTEISEVLKCPAVLNEGKIVQLVAAAAQELNDRGVFRGLFIVLDELGKFLEFAALHPERQDVYFLQQLGELSARSGNSCVFTVGLLHQGFGAYADKLSDAAQREWEKIAGRFEEMVFSQPLSQTADLVSAALKLKEAPTLLRGWKTKAQANMARAFELGMFGAAATKISLIHAAPNLYPIHPTVLPVLAKFFRRFGQNERSLFSFLLSSEPYGLQSFSAQKASPTTVYRLSDFYDFVAHNFGHRLSTQSFRSHWNHIDAVIRSYPPDRSTELRILKTVGILNTIESPELHPTTEILALALDDVSHLDAALKRLAARTTLYFRGSSRGYALWPHGSVNLEQAFVRASEIITSVPSVAEAIRVHLETRPIVASRHYIETGNLRYFEVVYSTVSGFETNASLLEAQYPADGRVIVVLCDTIEQQRRAEQFAASIKKRDAVLIGITSPLEMLTGLILEVERWTNVEQNTPELKDDRFAAEEVSRQLTVAKESLEKAIVRHISIGRTVKDSASAIQWFYNGEKNHPITVKSSLQATVSNICQKLFSDAPRIHNELVNRHDISSAATSARQKLFGFMLRGRREPMLGLPVDKAPPEKSMYLSVLMATKLHRVIDDAWDIQFPTPKLDKGNVLPALAHIVRMLEEKVEARVSVKQIIDELRRPPLGVRDGLTPLLLLVVLLEHEAEIAVYEDGRFMPEIEEFLMMRLAKQPHTFEFQLTRITGVRRRLIEKFAEILIAHETNQVAVVSVVRPLCAAVAALPEYVRLTDRLSGPALALRREILSSQEPADLVFNSIPHALGFNHVKSAEDAAAVAARLSASLNELRRAFPELQLRLSKAILASFGAENESLAMWRSRMVSRAEMVAVAVTEPELRAFALKLSDNHTCEGDWLESLGSFLVRRPPSRWRDQDEIAFENRLREVVQHYRRVEATHFGLNATEAQEAIRIALTRKTGEEADLVVTLSSRQSEAALRAQHSLEKVLPEDSNVALVALSQIAWSLIKQKP